MPPSIAATMGAEGGLVTFARFMELALTDPSAGYYASRELSLGPAGDFSTAPVMAPAFNRMIAAVLAEVVDAVEGSPVVVAEVGPGDGRLAAALVDHWDGERPDLRDRVALRLVDVKAEPGRALTGVLQGITADGWDASWASGPPGLEGLCLREPPTAVVVLTNELLDALPVHRVDVRGERPRECWVRLGGDALIEEWGDLSDSCAEELALLFGDCATETLRRHTRDGRIEVRPAAGDFVGAWARAFPEVCLVMVDYGEWRDGPLSAGAASVESLRGRPGPRPYEETVRGYAHHQRQADLYRSVGGQDLTADVDFRALAVHGGLQGLECVAFTTLAAALGGYGGSEEAARLQRTASSSLDDDRALTVLAGLLDPHGVGGLFKVMILAG